MKVAMELYCSRLLEPIKSGEYELNDDATIADLMDAAAERCGKPQDERAWEYVLFLLDQRPVLKDTALAEGDRLQVLWKIYGG